MATFSSARLIAAACSIFIVAALTACGTSGTSPGNTNSGAGSTAVGSSNGSDPKGDVIKAYRLQATKSYRLHETTTMFGPGGSQTFSRLLEVVPPDRTHATLDQYESITIGDAKYEKVNGNWSRSSGVSKQGVSKVVGKQILQQIESGALTITYVGRHAAEGTPAQVYEISGTMTIGETKIEGKQKIWISVGEGLPVRYESNSEHPYPMDSVLTYEYDPNIKIEAPIP